MAFDLGDTVPLAVNVADDLDQLTTPASLTLTIEQPDGTSITPSIENPSVGHYQTRFVPTLVGRHVVRWVSTVPATAFADVFDVRPAAPAYVVSLTDAKQHLNITSDYYDEELRGYIEAATGSLERYLGQAVVRRPLVQVVDAGRGVDGVALDVWPVVAVTAITAVSPSAPVFDVANADVTTSGILRMLRGPRLSGRLNIATIVGPSVMAPEVTMAAREIIESLFSEKRSASAGPPGQPGGEDDLARDPFGVVITPKVVELLGASGPLVA